MQTWQRNLDLMLNVTVLTLLKKKYCVHPKPLLWLSLPGPSSLGRGVTPEMRREVNLVAHNYCFLPNE